MACRIPLPSGHASCFRFQVAALRHPNGALRLGLKHARHNSILGRLGEKKHQPGSIWPPSSTQVRCLSQSRSIRVQRTDETEKPPTPPPTSPPPTPPKLRTLIADRLARTPAIHENIYTLPNVLTFSRLLATPLICYFVLHGQHYPAVLLFGYAGLTDLLDGWIARKWNQQSVVGSVVDPMADKALMVGLTTTLAYMGHLPLWLATIILGRDIALAIAAIYYRYASLPPPKTMARYWDFSLPSAEVHPTTVSKLNTLLQLLLIGATTALPLVPHSFTLSTLPSTVLNVLGDGESVRIHDLVGWFQWVVAGTTLWSGASYTWSRSAVKILRDDMERERKRQILRRGRAVIAVAFGGVVVGALVMDRPWDDDPL